ncbi:hypothetical protein F4814DRAFT_444143 [Daldinia grandis]|nr:hypothetical protein F4814DRAFT_444143 [Daldinia grandis]
MYPLIQRSPTVSEDRPRRRPNDILFDHEVYQHCQATVYRWSDQQSKVFQEYAREFRNDYAQNIDLLLEALDLHGYGEIETEQGLNFEGKILIPKVLRKLVKIVTHPGKNRRGSNKHSPQNSDSSTPANHRRIPRPMSNVPRDDIESDRIYYDTAKADNNEHVETAAPRPSQLFDTRSPGPFKRLPLDTYGSRGPYRNNQFEIAIRSLTEKVHNIENLIGVNPEDTASTWSYNSALDDGHVHR